MSLCNGSAIGDRLGPARGVDDARRGAPRRARGRMTAGGWQSAVLAVGVVLAGTAAALEPGAVLDYEVRYGPLQVMAMRTTTRFDGDRYQATSDARTVGVVAFLFPWSAASSSSGVRGDGGMHPLRYHSAGEYRGQRRLAEIDYDAGGSVRARVDPAAEFDERDAVPPALQQETVDPLTASLAAIASDCRGTLRVFDGRRRYDLVVSDLGTAMAPSSRHGIYSGVARHCRAAIQPLAGFWRAATHDEQPSQIDFWIAAPRRDLLAVPVHLELSAPGGTLAIDLSAVEPLGATLSAAP